MIELSMTSEQARQRREERREARAAARRQRRNECTKPRKKKAQWRRERTDEAYLDFIRGLPCLVCGEPPRSEAHHEPPKGLGGGGSWHDRKTIPLCTSCHTTGPKARHLFGSRKNWERAVGVFVMPWIQRLNVAFEMGRQGRSRGSR